MNSWCGQELLQCSVLLDKLHKLSQSRLQRFLLVRHEEASAKVQRQIIEWRRVELHKIFSEELEEATRTGELEKSTARSLQHQYFACQVRSLIDNSKKCQNEKSDVNWSKVIIFVTAAFQVYVFYIFCIFVIYEHLFFITSNASMMKENWLSYSCRWQLTTNIMSFMEFWFT